MNGISYGASNGPHTFEYENNLKLQTIILSFYSSFHYLHSSFFFNHEDLFKYNII